jgi:hypothetical protein
MDAVLLGFGLIVAFAHGCASPERYGNTQLPSRQAMQASADTMAPNLRITDAPAPIARGRSEVVQVTAAQEGPALNQPTPTDPATHLRELYSQAAAHYAQVDSYIVRLKRREQINGRDKPMETLLFKFRRAPFSVYFKWLGDESHGREVVYVKGQYEGKIHTLLAAGDVPLMPAGRRMALLPDNPLVRSSSRHSITEAGVGHLIEKFGYLVESQTRAPSQRPILVSLGTINRPEMPGGAEAVTQTIPPGTEPQLARGGKRLWAFDPLTKFPVLVVTVDETGHEVEYYHYERFEYPVRLDDDDFNPDRLWAPGGSARPRQTAKPTILDAQPVNQTLPH